MSAIGIKLLNLAAPVERPLPVADITTAGGGFGDTMRNCNLFQNESLEVRLWSRVAINDETSCWEWTGCRRNATEGYGLIHAWGRYRLVHRVAYEMLIGPVPDSILICHHCDNPPCCNPAHLFPGTQRDNILDCVAKGRKNLPYGERSGSARLTGDDVRAIRSKYATGTTTIAALTREYPVSRSQIGLIVHNRRWRYSPCR